MSKMRESPGSVQSTVFDCDRAVIRESPKGLVESAISDREPRAAKGRAKTAIADTAAKKILQKSIQKGWICPIGRWYPQEQK